MMHTRYRRFLSADRRGGIQVPPDVADGRTARYAQSWRDLNEVDDDIDNAPAGIIHALVLGFCVWCIVALAVVGAVAVLG